MKTTWILVANKASAHVYASTPRDRPILVETYENPEGRMRDSELASDEPGSSFESRGVARHQLQPRETPSEHATELFVRRLAGKLDEAAALRKFDQLVLVCSHGVLGSLRQRLGPQSASLVTASVAKDIAKWPQSEVVAALRKILDEDSPAALS